MPISDHIIPKKTILCLQKGRNTKVLIMVRPRERETSIWSAREVVTIPVSFIPGTVMTKLFRLFRRWAKCRLRGSAKLVGMRPKINFSSIEILIILKLEGGTSIPRERKRRWMRINLQDRGNHWANIWKYRKFQPKWWQFSKESQRNTTNTMRTVKIRTCQDAVLGKAMKTSQMTK